MDIGICKLLFGSFKFDAVEFELNKLYLALLTSKEINCLLFTSIKIPIIGSKKSHQVHLQELIPNFRIANSKIIILISINPRFLILPQQSIHFNLIQLTIITKHKTLFNSPSRLI